MEIFKIWALLLSFVLAPLGVYATDETEKLPSFYFLEEVEDGQTFRISACYRRESVLSGSGIYCPNRVDVDREDLDRLLVEIDSEMESNFWPYVINIASLISFSGGGAGIILSVIDFFDKSPILKKRGIVFVSSGMVAFTSLMVLLYNNFGAKTYASLDELYDQILSGMVLGDDDNEDHNRRIFDRFETFLQDFGRPVVPVVAERP